MSAWGFTILTATTLTGSQLTIPQQQKKVEKM
jgi:hypothetical protein